VNPLVLGFLATLNCHPAVTYEAAERSYFKAGVVYLAPGADSGVLVHELWHACQEQRYGPAKSRLENEAREAEARKIELIWRYQ
jgi:hypothetical protein